MKDAVIITGASSGTGYTIAEKFASEGYTVILTSRSQADADAAAEKIRQKFHVDAKGYQLCGKAGSDVYEMFSEIEGRAVKLKAVVLNAANLGMNMPCLTADVDSFREVLETNLCWNFLIARQAALQMKNEGGAIVFIGSNTCRRAIKNRSAYIASKGGVLSLSKALAVELGEYHIRVNTVIAGSIKTRRWDLLDEKGKEEKKKRVPIRDIADFEDIANAAWFLCSELSGNVTGAEIVVDGGADAQLFPGS